jgi:hypothetical protein
MAISEEKRFAINLGEKCATSMYLFFQITENRRDNFVWPDTLYHTLLEMVKTQCLAYHIKNYCTIAQIAATKKLTDLLKE